ncbi:MAG: hypothetical protein LBK70_03240 [Clostridiales bacterium]|jgi:hypothetical protein|nr:hypothetical protein [Clostridiales bacterium]
MEDRVGIDEDVMQESGVDNKVGVNKSSHNLAHKKTILQRHMTTKIEDKVPKKVGWFKRLIFAQPQEDEDVLEMQKQTKLVSETLSSNKQLSDYVNQLDKKVEQNNAALMQTLQSLKANNDSLLKQVRSLSETNKQLYEKLLVSNKKARVFKIFALLASISTIAVSVWRIWSWLQGNS